jgi:hypothetical protein
MTDGRLILLPRVSATGALHIWAGAYGADTLGVGPTFTIDGTPATFEVVRAWKAALPAGQSNARSVTCGLYRTPLARGKSACIAARLGTLRAEVRTRALPGELSGTANTLNVLLTSCYDYHEEPMRGLVSSVVQKLGTSLSTRPDLTILAGDQVYLDQPLGDFPDDESWLRRKFHEDYKRNWFSGLEGVLTTAPAVHMADDHEYWNNFPHRSPIVANSFSDDGCRRWKDAAASQFAAFQDAQ